MRRWPPLIWPGITLASSLVLLGGAGGGRPVLLVVGIALELAIFGLSLYLAVNRWSGRAGRRQVYRAMAGLGLFYVAIGVAASTAGLVYAVAGLLAGTIPLTALALMTATIPQTDIGLDDQTPLGETPEHADADARFHRNDRLERAHRKRVRDQLRG